MREDGVAQFCIRQLRDHGDLDSRHELPCVRAERGEAQDAIAAGFHQRFQESACFGERARPQHFLQGDLEQAVRNAPSLSLLLAEADTGKLGVDEYTEWNLPAACHMVPAVDIVANDLEIVEADVSELRPACYVADGPDSSGGRLKPLIDLHVSIACELDAGQLQSYAVCVRRAPRRRQ